MSVSYTHLFNATHAMNIAIQTMARTGERVVISGYEHNSVVRPLKDIGAEMDVVSSELFEPEVALSVFDRKITAGASLVIVNHVSLSLINICRQSRRRTCFKF